MKPWKPFGRASRRASRPASAALAAAALALMIAPAAGGAAQKARAGVARGRGRPRLVIVRHGESEANRAGRFAGWTDVPLTAKGRKQATAAGRKLRASGIRFDRGYSSELRRAADTMTLLLDGAGQTGVPTARRRSLNERRYGILEGLTRAEAIERYGEDQVNRWRLSRNEGPPGGDSLEDMVVRARSFLAKEAIPALEAGENVVVTTHRHWIRGARGEIEGLSQKQLEELEPDNAEPIVYELGRDGKLHLVPDGLEAPGHSRPARRSATGK